MARKQPPTPTWFRRIVPSGYQLGTLVFEGVTPLLMKSDEYDRRGDTYRAHAVLSAKTRKTIDDYDRLRELDWALSLYLDPTLGPYFPGRCVKRMMRDAATKYRKGEDIKKSFIVIPTRIPLMYDGPRDQAGLWRDGYELTNGVVVGGFRGSRIERCRPKFDQWGLVVECAFDPEDLDEHLIPVITERTHKSGCGDWRPAKGGEYGTFVATWIPGELHKAASNGDALKPECRELLRTHVAFCKRFMTENGGPAS